MGTCCPGRDFCDTNTSLPVEFHFEKKNTRVSTLAKTVSENTMKKNPTIFFDKSDFINIKTKSLFEDYEINEKLGEGAFGCVYKVKHRKTALTRAVKAIKRSHVDEKSFQNEIAILKSVDHPNIIRLFECYYDHNYYYMVEEFCSGGDLYDFIKRQKNFSEKKASIIMNQLLSALNHLHSKKYVHRDLKPENIVFITSDSEDIFIKLIDFGTSVTFKNEPLTQELGTIFYIAPEVFKNKYNEKCDVWSCGIILYTMLCGHPPFRGTREKEIKSLILKGNIEFRDEVWKKITNEAKNFIISLLCYDPDKRSSAEQALSNKWFVKFHDSSEDNVLDSKIVNELIKFHSGLRLQKAAIAFIANQIGQNQEIKKIKAEFDKIDENKDGVLQKDEVIACLKKIYSADVAVAKAQKIFDEIDFNNDGTINFSEFLTVALNREIVLSEEMLKNAFDMFDLDGNGFLTIDELRETIPIAENGEMTWEEIMKEVDKNGDGQISFEEFKCVMNLLGKHILNPEDADHNFII